MTVTQQIQKEATNQKRQQSYMLQPYLIKTNEMSQMQELHDLQHEMTG